MKKNIWRKNCLICGSLCNIFQKKLFDDRYGAPGKYSIYKCNNCGFGRLEPVVNHKKISQFYSKYYPLNSITTEQVTKEINVKPKWLAWLTGTNNTTHWRILPKSTVLDIGSASGISLVEIKKIGGIAYGVEPDSNAQKIATKLKLQVYKGFITGNPFPGKKFDFITASQVIEHESDLSGFLEAVTKRLDQGGKIILGFPNGDSLYRKIFGKVWINWHVPYHINFFTKKSFSCLAKQTGLKIIQIDTVTPNLWTLLQFRTLFVKAKEGEKNPVWLINTYNNIAKRNPPILKYKIIFLKILITIIMIPVTIINRIVDLFGQGDSFIVILEKEYE